MARMKLLALAAVLLLASVSRATEDVAGPVVANTTVIATATNLATGDGVATVCAQVTDALSGTGGATLLVNGPTKNYFPSFGNHDPASICLETTVAGLPTCNAGATGTCRRATDCTASDNCSSGGGTTKELLLCNGSAWVVETTTTYPSTLCGAFVHIVPRYGIAGDYTVYIQATDGVGNATQTSAGVVALTNSP